MSEDKQKSGEKKTSERKMWLSRRRTTQALGALTVGAVGVSQMSTEAAAVNEWWRDPAQLEWQASDTKEQYDGEEYCITPRLGYWGSEPVSNGYAHKFATMVPAQHKDELYPDINAQFTGVKGTDGTTESDINLYDESTGTRAYDGSDVSLPEWLKTGIKTAAGEAKNLGYVIAITELINAFYQSADQYFDQYDYISHWEFSGDVREQSDASDVHDLGHTVVLRIVTPASADFKIESALDAGSTTGKTVYAGFDISVYEDTDPYVTTYSR